LSDAPYRFSFPSPLLGVVMMLNRLLRNEPWARQSLVPFAGKTARITMPPFGLSVAVTDQGLFDHLAADQQADVTIELPLARVGSVATGGSSMAHEIRLEGDPELAEVLGRLASHLRPDVEEHLSRVIGDVAAVRVTGTLKGLAESLKEAHRRFAANLAEYLLHEDPQLVHPRAIDEFVEGVHRLRDDLARLEKRIERLGLS